MVIGGRPVRKSMPRSHAVIKSFSRQRSEDAVRTHCDLLDVVHQLHNPPSRSPLSGRRHSAFFPASATMPCSAITPIAHAAWSIQSHPFNARNHVHVHTDLPRGRQTLRCLLTSTNPNCTLFVCVHVLSIIAPRRDAGALVDHMGSSCTIPSDAQSFSALLARTDLVF